MAHSGSWQGFKTYFVRYPEEGISVVVFANIADADVTAIAHGIAALWNPALQPLPEE